MTLDDATGAIYSAFLVEEEGTASTFRALKEVFSEHGLPMSLYTDRGAHYFRTTKAGEIDRGCPTQVGRALAQLGVEHIGAFSACPSRAGARRRLGARVPDAAGPAGEGTEARRDHRRSRRPTPSSARSICPPTTPASPSIRPARARPSRPFRASISTRSCASQEERQVSNDNCVSYRTLKLQIPESPMRPHFVKARVKVHVYPDGSHALFHGPRCIGRYDQNGAIRDAKNAA